MYLSNFLLSSSIKLALVAQQEKEVMNEVIALLSNDHRIAKWNEFLQAITSRPAFPIRANNQKSIIIYHGRTNTVQDLVMAVGRSKQGVVFEGYEQPVHLVFVIVVPSTLNNEYLRIVGAIARACQHPVTLEQLLSTENVSEFIRLLSEECRG